MIGGPLHSKVTFDQAHSFAFGFELKSSYMSFIMDTVKCSFDGFDLAVFPGHSWELSEVLKRQITFNVLSVLV